MQKRLLCPNRDCHAITGKLITTPLRHLLS